MTWSYYASKNPTNYFTWEACRFCPHSPPRKTFPLDEIILWINAAQRTRVGGAWGENPRRLYTSDKCPGTYVSHISFLSFHLWTWTWSQFIVNLQDVQDSLPEPLRSSCITVNRNRQWWPNYHFLLADLFFCLESPVMEKLLISSKIKNLSNYPSKCIRVLLVWKQAISMNFFYLFLMTSMHRMPLKMSQ